VIETFLLHHVPTIWLAIGMVVVAVALALLGLVVVRRIVAPRGLREQHDVAGFIIAVVGVLYAVLLAFMVIIQWEQYTTAGHTAGTEATAVGNLYRDAVSVGPAGRPLVAAVDGYAREVVDREWPYMAKHQEEDPNIDHFVNAMWAAVTRLPTSTATQGFFVRQAVSDVSTVSETRRTRVEESSAVLPWPLWLVLLAGGALTIGFTYFFGLERFVPQAGMVSSLAIIIALSLFVILTLELPFTGQVATKPSQLKAEMVEFCSYNFVHPQQGANCKGA
jgi:hypothetical protein